MNLAEKLSKVWQTLTGTPEGIIALVVSVLVFAVLYYYIVKFLIDNESGSLVLLFVFVMLVSAAIITFIPNLNSSIFLLVPGVFVVAILVLYSVEIRRIIWTRKNMKLVDIKHDSLSYDEEKIQV